MFGTYHDNNPTIAYQGNMSNVMKIPIIIIIMKKVTMKMKGVRFA